MVAGTRQYNVVYKKKETLWSFHGHKISEFQSFTLIFLPCYDVLCSSLLTETLWIYRNFIGRETKPDHIQIFRQVMTNKKYQSFVN